MNKHNNNYTDECYQYHHHQEDKFTRRKCIENDDVSMSELKPTLDELHSMRSVWYYC